MSRIAVFTLTRDRLEYTKLSFSSLREKAGYPFDHYVIDNGSIDGTREWLEKNKNDFTKIIFLPKNVGISKGTNLALDTIGRGYDLIVKFDNDCEVISDDILKKISGIYSSSGKFRSEYALSPRVSGINNQPFRARNDGIGGYTIGLTSIIGGLFQVVPFQIYDGYRLDESLPLAKGQDDALCHYIKTNGGQVGYIEELEVRHMDGTDGQAKKYPEYFERKWREEKE